MRRHNHFVSGADIERHQAQTQGIEPVGHADAVTAAAKNGKLLLESDKLFGQHVMPACDKPRESRLEARRVLPVKSGQIKKRNLHAYRACVSRRKSA